MNDEDVHAIVREFAEACRIAEPTYGLLGKGGETFLAIHVGQLNPLYERALSQVCDALPHDHPFKNNIFLQPKRPPSWLGSQECHLLQNHLAGSLTIGKSNLTSPLLSSATLCVGDADKQVLTEANHVIFGRRGAGKSTLLLRACTVARERGIPFAWVAMQQFQGRDDLLVIPQFLYELVTCLESCEQVAAAEIADMRRVVVALETQGLGIQHREIKASLPVFSRALLAFVRRRGQLYLLIDDLHLVSPQIQPYLLSALYSFSRGNNIFLKITAIEHLTNLYKQAEQEGLQTPGDAQVIRLDYNLVNPETAHSHIRAILENYVRFVGIPALNRLVAGVAPLERLTWTSAGVPRDALYIFNNSLTKARQARRDKVSVTDINMAAADNMIEKERNATEDIRGHEEENISRAVGDIKEFCLREERRNAFLVRINLADPAFRLIHKISDLRFIHVLHPGITPERAGEKYEVYLLDYGFYTGFRKTPSVCEVVTKPRTPSAKELRKLPRYPYEERLRAQ